MRDYRPTDHEELRDMIGAAAADRRALRIRGRDSKVRWGHTVQAADTLTLNGISGVLEYQPAELYMTALAGTPVSEINACLAERNQQLAFEPCPGMPCQDNSDGSIGGVFACNVAGPRRFSSGAARDHLLGFQAISGRGDHFQAGGTVVKNVTGYDLCKLLTGSFGTLAVFHTLSFRVMPIARRRITLAITGVDTATALARCIELAGSNWQPSGLVWLAPGPPGQPLPELQRHPGCGILLIRLEGLPRGTADRASRLRKTLGDRDPILVLEQETSDLVWRAVRDLDELGRVSNEDVLLRISLPPASAPRLAGALSKYAQCRWLVDHGGATFWIRVSAEQSVPIAARSRALLSDIGGAMTVVDASADERSELSRFGPLDMANARLNGRLKASLDPANILNPGKLGSVVDHADTV